MWHISMGRVHLNTIQHSTQLEWHIYVHRHRERERMRWSDDGMTPLQCGTYQWVVSHFRMSRVTHINESCHTYEWVVSHIWMSRVTHMNESCHTYQWVTANISMSHVTHMNADSIRMTPSQSGWLLTQLLGDTRSLLQNNVSFIGLFYKTDLQIFRFY